jgi:hypothetical protein
MKPRRTASIASLIVTASRISRAPMVMVSIASSLVAGVK